MIPRLCAQCVTLNEPDSVFCKKCGAQLGLKPARPWPTPPHQAPPVKKRPPAVALALFAILGMGVLYGLLKLAAWVLVSVLVPAAFPEPVKVAYEVVSRTHSRAAVSVTYANESNGTNHEGAVRVPWRKDLVLRPGSRLYVSARLQDTDGSVTVNIYVNNALVKTSTSSGRYAMVAATGTL